VSDLERPAVWRRHVRREADDYLRPFLLTIGEYADATGTVRRRTRAQLADDLAKTERTVQRWIRRAVDDGWLVVLVRGQKHRSSQVYGLTIPPSQGDTRSPVRETLRETPPRSLRTQVQGDTSCLPHKNRVSDREHVAVDRTAPTSRPAPASHGTNRTGPTTGPTTGPGRHGANSNSAMTGEHGATVRPLTAIVERDHNADQQRPATPAGSVACARPSATHQGRHDPTTGDYLGGPLSDWGADVA